MQQAQILYPVAAMAALTFAVGSVLLRLRFRAVGRGEVNPRYFLLNRGARLPDYLARWDQHYSNLLELPLLFYVLCLALYLSSAVTPVQLVLAWGFVATRLVHSMIHTTVNRLRLRMLAFAAGAVLLMLGWLGFVTELAGR